MKKHIVKLSSEERLSLQSLLKQGKLSHQKNQRVRILLKSDQSDGQKWLKDEEISQALDISLPTVERTRRRFVESGLEACLENAKRINPSPLLKVDGELEAQILMLACSEVPSGRSRWTLQLIADQLVELNLVESISDETIRRTLKKTKSNPGRRNNGA